MVHMGYSYSIDAVAHLTGISAFTLRNWEKRYEFLRPKRLKNGFRAYDDAHVEMLRKVSILIRHGARVGDLAESIRKGKSLPDLLAPEIAPEVEKQVTLLYASLMQYNLEHAEEIHTTLEASYEPIQMLDLIYAPLISRLRHEGDESESALAQGYFASSFIRLRLSALLASPSNPKTRQPKKVICATPVGQRQSGELMLLAAHLKLKGWSTYYMGSNFPIESMLTAAKSIMPKVVCISFADKHGIHASLKRLSLFECKVCIGGIGALTFDAEESLPDHLYLLKTGGFTVAEVIETL